MPSFLLLIVGSGGVRGSKGWPGSEGVQEQEKYGAGATAQESRGQDVQRGKHDNNNNVFF